MSIHSLIQEQNTACTEQLHVPHLHRVAEDGGAEKKIWSLPLEALILVETQHLYTLQCDHFIACTPKTDVVLYTKL